MAKLFSFVMLGFFMVTPSLGSEKLNSSNQKATYFAVLNANDPHQIVFGDEKALLTVILYTSFSCGHCGHFHTTVFPKLQEKYIRTGKIRLIMRHFPTDATALKIAVLFSHVPALRKEAVLNTLFAQQENWSMDSSFKKVMAICGFSGEGGFFSEKNAQKMINDKKELDQVLQHRLEIEKIARIEGTPTFWIEDAFYPHELTLEQFDHIVTKHLSEKTGLKDR